MSLILDLIFPKTCYGCGLVSNYLCPSCLKKIRLNSLIFYQKSQFEGSLSLFKYHSLVKNTLVGIKYDFITDACHQISQISAKQIIKNFPHILEYWQQNNFILVPIPLHPFRFNWRGFNQSEIIGQDLAKTLKLGYSDQILTRFKDTSPQVKLKNKYKRITNLSNAFSINPQHHKYLPQNIILFDDVYTTGGTLNSALSALTSSNLHRCWSLTIAG